MHQPYSRVEIKSIGFNCK